MSELRLYIVYGRIWSIVFILSFIFVMICFIKDPMLEVIPFWKIIFIVNLAFYIGGGFLLNKMTNQIKERLKIKNKERIND